MSIIIRMIIVMIASFVLNIPLGMWRKRTKKFSLSWFISIHIAVPLIFILRVSEGLAYWTIPIFVASAVLGQIAGGRLSFKVFKAEPVLSKQN